MAVLAVNFAPSSCFAIVAVDQQFAPTVPLTYSNVGSNNEVDWSQTFTVGRNGQLAGFDAWVYRFPEISLPLLFDVRRTNATAPTEPDSGANILVGGMVAAADVPILPPTNEIPQDFVRVMFESPVSVTAGDVLAITLRSDDPGLIPSRWTYTWLGNYDSTYQGGMAFARVGPSFANPTDGWVADGNLDFGFTTYLAPVPEPGTLCVGLIAVATLCCQVRPERSAPRRKTAIPRTGE
jgi:hypothetical protein